MYDNGDVVIDLNEYSQNLQDRSILYSDGDTSECRYRDGKRITVVDCGDKAAEWLAEVVGKELRLVCHLHIVKGQKQSKKVKSDHGLVFKVFR